MRRTTISIGRRIPALPYPSSPFSTSSGGSGRGRGGGAPNPDFISRAPGSRPAPRPEESKTNSAQPPPPPPPPSGHGRGRPVHPAFYSFVESAGIGRGGDGRGSVEFTEELNLPSAIMSALPKPGVGRGKPDHNMPLPKPLIGPPEEENRHLKARSKPKPDPRPKPSPGVEKGGAGPAQPKVINQEEAAKNALRILSRKEGAEDSWGGGRGDRRSGRGGEGQRGMGRERGRKRDIEDSDTQEEGGLDWGGDPAAEERLAKRVGPENVAMLTEAFEEIQDKVLPDPVDDAILDAWETNFNV